VGVIADVIPENTIRVLDHGFVRLDDAMASDLSVVNSARVSFGRRKDVMEEADEGLIRFLMRDRHGTPFEHNSFRFHIRAPIFVTREWMRHRVGCLTGDTEITFVDTNGHATPKLRKTIDDLWTMWSEGERNGHALSAEQAAQVDALAANGASGRETARRLGVGRRSVRSHLRRTNALRDARWRVKRMRLRALNEETNEFVDGHIAAIVEKGVQPVYRLTLADGKHVTLTENHRVLTSRGWRTMREAVGLVGDGHSAVMTRDCSLLTNGIPAHQDKAWMGARRAEGKSVSEIASTAGCSYHTVRKWLAIHDLRFTREERYRSREPWNKGKKGYRIRLVVSDRHRAAIRHARSGPNSNFWRDGITSDRAAVAAWTTLKASSVHAQYDYTCQHCRERGGRLHAHHIVPVWLDPSRARDVRNLITLCGECHAAVHLTQESELGFASEFADRIGFVSDQPAPVRRGWKLTAHAVRVAFVEYVGLRQTYDLCVEGPWHNFVANGVVVHNSFNEFSMRYAKATDEFYVPDADDVRSQVGKPGAYSFEPVSADLAEATREELRNVYETAYATYERLVEQGVARELARAVIPVGAFTEFYWTVNARALMNFVSLRAAETAQREIRRYAEACEAFFAERMPVTHAAFLDAGRVAP
jgi:thymidylate synthase (FAD)